MCVLCVKRDDRGLLASTKISIFDMLLLSDGGKNERGLQSVMLEVLHAHNRERKSLTVKARNAGCRRFIAFWQKTQQTGHSTPRMAKRGFVKAPGPLWRDNPMIPKGQKG